MTGCNYFRQLRVSTALDRRTAAVAENNDKRIIDTIELNLTIAPTATQPNAISQQPPRCLRDNESSQQQLVRLVGYRGPAVSTAASWDRLRREQAALQAS
jgi:hypothetical protein